MPIIFFRTAADDNLANDLRVHCQPENLFVGEVTKQDDLRGIRSTIAQMETGLVITTPDFARGTNLRFQFDALVVIYDNALPSGTNLNWSIVEQMAGRASRISGPLDARLFARMGEHYNDGSTRSFLASQNTQDNDDRYLTAINTIKKAPSMTPG